MQPLIICASLADDRFGGGPLVGEERRLVAEPALNDLPHLPLDLTVARSPVADLLPLQELLDALRPRAVLPVASLPLPCLEWVVLHSIEPAADQGVADLDLVVEERERQSL